MMIYAFTIFQLICDALIFLLKSLCLMLQPNPTALSTKNFKYFVVKVP